LDAARHEAEELHETAAKCWRETKRADAESERDEAAGRAVALDVPLVWDGPTSRAMNWARALAAYESFWRDSRPRHAPRENTRNRSSLSTAERNGGEWARYQRRFRSRLSEFQKIRLTVSPAFQWDPLEVAWMARLAECRQHYARVQRLPFLNGSNSTERHLARWLNYQLRQKLSGRLAPARAEALDRFLGNPRESSVDEAFPSHGCN
jgi:hypothetical protein